MRLRRLAGLVGAAATAVVVVVVAPASAATNYEDSVLPKCSRYAADTGWVNASTEPVGDGHKRYTVRVDFVLGPERMQAARCASDYLELSVPIGEFSLPDQFDGYTLETDLPGGLHDLAVFDDSNHLSPGVTAVPTASLEVDRWYYFEVSWIDDAGKDPWFSLQWSASHWAGTYPGSSRGTLIKEFGACPFSFGSGNMAWCVFSHEDIDWDEMEMGADYFLFPRPGEPKLVIRF